MTVPFPDDSRFPDNQLVEWRNVENKYSKLHFAINISPKLVLQQSYIGAPSPEKPIVNLAFFRTAGKRVELTIQASVIQHEINLRDYYHFFAERGQEEVINVKPRASIDAPPDLLM